VICYRQQMIRALVVSLAFVVGCSKAKDEAKPAPQVAPTKAADGIRKIPVSATADGYTPDKIPGKPNEKLVLVFTRTVDANCLAQLKTPDGKMVDLPMNTPVEVAVTVPATGEVGFACGMDMFHGVVVAQPNT
jgi:plastocyanin domain-containing protein